MEFLHCNFENGEEIKFIHLGELHNINININEIEEETIHKLFPMSMRRDVYVL